MLKSLELYGFKSFADRTLFEFSPGITCVVGPNGSGKSNVVDALKWILGDQSAKSLRGKEMADVIFNGSAGRRGSGFAEATLTFDNANGLLPVNTAEVQVGRRLYQSGDSEYLLNQSAVRLKDIRDLFMGTGAGTAAYSIIEQGRVDQILQGSPTARRVVFEEAAGISRFKSRRIEAERRLERVAQNLLRLTDIVDQVESQLNATRSQASKAARYRDLSQELHAAWTGLAADDCRVISQQLDCALDQTTEITESLRQLGKRLETLEQEQQQLAGQSKEIEGQIARRDREVSTLRELIASDESALRHQSSRHDDLTAEIQRLRHQRLVLDRQLDLAGRELHDAEEKLNAFQNQMQRSRQEVAERETQLAELEELAKQRQARITEQQTELAQAQRQRSRLADRQLQRVSQRESVCQNQSQAKHRLQRLQQQQQQAEADLQAVREQRDAAAAELAARQDSLNHSRTELSRFIDQLQQTEQQHREFRERRSAAEARLTVLEELESRQEGISLGVREILRRAGSSHYPPWNRILGLVRDLIEVPMELAPIVDAALGERAQLIAVSDLQSILDYLNRGAPPIDGRVGFVSIADLPRLENDPDSENRPAAPEQDFTGQPGVFGRADRLVKETSPAHGLAQRVLGDTWIVENLDVARSVIDAASQPIRAVTLQGEVLSNEASLFVGTMPHETSIVSRKSELRLLKNELHQLQRGIETTASRLEILASDRDAANLELHSLDADLKSLSQALTESSTQVTGQEQALERLQQEFAEQQQILKTLQEQEQALLQEEEQITGDIARQDEQLATLSGQLEHEQEQMAGATSLLQETRLSIQTARMELSTHEQRLSELQSVQSRLQRDQQARQRQRQEIETRASELRQTRRRLNFEMLAAGSRIATHALSRDGLVEQGRELDRRLQKVREQLSGQRRQLDELHAQRRQLNERQHKLEFAIQKDRHKLQTLADRIQEEYQVSLEDLVSSGVSAYQSFLDERFPQSQPGAEDSEVDEIADSHPEPVPTFEEVREELEAQVDRLRRKIKMLGSINTDALENLEELESRYATLSGQLNDLQTARSSLEEIIRRINRESQRIFLETFETVRLHFQELFRKLFGGGDADIILENPEDVLECGIEIVARPPGKELRSISLLSGGEKTMTAVAMLFAMFKSKPSPYCILDEVDAALDEANVDRYVAVLKEFVEMTQFVVITHRKRTMTAADVLYGVTMEQAGVSKRMSVRFEDVSDNGEIRSAA